MNPALFHQLARERTNERVFAGETASARAHQAELHASRPRRRWRPLRTGR